MLFLFLISFFIPKVKKDTYGSASIKKKLPNLKRFNKGIKVGNRCLSKNDSTKNVLLIGPSGSGKTMSILLENIFKLAKNNWSLFILDPKNELVKLSSGYLSKKLGIRTYIMDFVNPENSIQWNPFEEISRSKIQSLITDMYEITASSNNKTEAIWKFGSIEIISLCCNLILNNKPSSLNLGNLSWVLKNIQSNPEKLKDWMLKNCDTELEILTTKQFFNQDDKVFHGIISTSISTLTPFVTEECIKISSKTTLPPIGSFREKQSVIYVSLPIGCEANFMPYVTLFLNNVFVDILNTPVKNTDRHIGFILEEFGNIFPINNYSSIVSSIRSKRCSLVHCVQNISQISYRYGKFVTDIVLNNCAHLIMLTGSKSQSTNSYISETLIGKSTQRKINNSGVEDEYGRMLYFQDEIRRLPKNTALFISSNLPASLIKLKPIYKAWLKKYRFGLVSYKGILKSVFSPVVHTKIRSDFEYIDFLERKDVSVSKEEVLTFQERLEKLLPKK